MSYLAARYDWLPHHQLHVAATLAHVDRTMDQVLTLIHTYSEQRPLTFAESMRDSRTEVRVKAVAPLPQAVPRLIADALTQLRAAVEHTLYAETEFLLGRPLAPDEAKSIEMPAFVEVSQLDKWLQDRRRRKLPPLRAGTPLVDRIKRLQPFQRKDSADHPMRLLAEHTNLAKHRTPAVAATRLGAVYPDDPRSDLTVALPLRLRPQPGEGLPLQPGDIVASAPQGERIAFSVIPTVSLQRPHTQVWNIAAHELQLLEEWVRTTAIPILITGTRDVPALPPQLDITVGHQDLRVELADAGRMPAAIRAANKMAADAARSGLAELLAPTPNSPDAKTIRAWAASLDDEASVEHLQRLARVSTDAAAASAAYSTLVAEARGYDPDAG
ncbi:hypothetical protein ACIRTB_20855 [Streptomyces sp. NPDC101158]|uniref:hypothetical protein n=1 Tax=Streptomyces sp. NPDC101158 TaxID=3366117 RepID=UPI0037F12AE1